jgi:hypothetical protein
MFTNISPGVTTLLDVPESAFDGSVHGGDFEGGASKKISLVPTNILLRGSSLRNTEWVIGGAVQADSSVPNA